MDRATIDEFNLLPRQIQEKVKELFFSESNLTDFEYFFYDRYYDAIVEMELSGIE